jgi:hypothetical protein
MTYVAHAFPAGSTKESRKRQTKSAVTRRLAAQALAQPAAGEMVQQSFLRPADYALPKCRGQS